MKNMEAISYIYNAYLAPEAVSFVISLIIHRFVSKDTYERIK